MPRIDLHNHLLWGVDDGCLDAEETAVLAKVLLDLGFTKAAATPHISPGRFAEAPAVRERLKEARTFLAERQIPLEILDGGEHYLSADLFELLETGEVIPYQGTKRLLIECSLGGCPPMYRQWLFQVRLKGFQPVLAHPERYPEFQAHPERLAALVAEDAIIQVDICSAAGEYGRAAQKCAQKLLTGGLVHVLGTDAHHPEDAAGCLREGLAALEQWLGPGPLEQLLSDNPARLLAGAELRPVVP